MFPSFYSYIHIGCQLDLSGCQDIALITERVTLSCRFYGFGYGSLTCFLRSYEFLRVLPFIPLFFYDRKSLHNAQILHFLRFNKVKNVKSHFSPSFKNQQRHFPTV